MSSVGRPKRDRYWSFLIGQWIRSKREKILGMKQGELAQFVKVTRTTVNKWESGKVGAPMPKVVAIYELAKMVSGGTRDRAELHERLNKLTNLDVDGLLDDLTASVKRQAQDA